MKLIRNLPIDDALRSRIKKYLIERINERTICCTVEELITERTTLKRYLSNDKRFFKKHGEHKYTIRRLFLDRKITEITNVLEGTDEPQLQTQKHETFTF